MSIVEEAGYLGSRLISLGNVPGKFARGRVLNQDIVTITAATIAILNSNTQRISAIIQNSLASTSALRLSFGQAVAVISIQLEPGDFFQIDENFPWTGDIRGSGDGVGTCFVPFIEVSVP